MYTSYGDTMVYLFYGTKEFLIENEVSKILNGIDSLNINSYDFLEDSLSLVLEDCQTYSMFGGTKAVKLKNSLMFTPGFKDNMDTLYNYLCNINKDTILIFTVYEDKIDERKKITKKIREVGKVLSFNDDADMVSFVRSNLKGYKIDFETVKLFLSRVGTNPLNILNEINKIKLYKGDNNVISSDDIITLTVKSLDISIFKLIDDIVKKDVTGALEIYENMRLMNEEPLKIIIMLANQFRIMYQVKGLFSKGKSEKEIADILKIHPYRVKLALSNSRNYKAETLLNYLNILSDIDFKIKSGLINKDVAFYMFLLKK